MKRTGVRRRSRNTGPTAEVVDLIGARDNGRCAVCGEVVSGERGWDWSCQHRLRRGGGGTRRPWVNWPSNLVLLCGSGTTRCHGRVEVNRTWAERFGYRVVDGVTLPSGSPILHAVHGWAYLTDGGGWIPCESL